MIRSRFERFLRFVLFSLLFSLCPFPSLFAQNSSAEYTRRGDYLNLKLAVIGPGDELYFWWGHIGLVIEDRILGQTRFFDWGVFSFDDENFFVNFALGRLLYSCAASRSESYYNVYMRTNRDITLYTLDIPAHKKEEILRFAEHSILPENRDYYYHHFRDNCATRVRDVIDIALDGQFKAEFAQAPGRYTLREHIRRHTWFNPFFDWILSFWMGQDIDVPITVWEEMFLPSEIAQRASEFRFSDGRPLVSNVETIFSSQGRPIVLESPPNHWQRELLVSLFVSSLLVLLYLFRRRLTGKKDFMKAFLGIQTALFGLFFGIAGSMLFFMAYFTDHDYTYNNSNILFVNPLFLLLIPLGIIYGFTNNERKRHITIRLLCVFWGLTLLGALFSMLLKLSPLFYQQNEVSLALVLPLAFTQLLLMIKLECNARVNIV